NISCGAYYRETSHNGQEGKQYFFHDSVNLVKHFILVWKRWLPVSLGRNVVPELAHLPNLLGNKPLIKLRQNAERYFCGMIPRTDDLLLGIQARSSTDLRISGRSSQPL